MIQYVAFLRGINVGGHKIIKMGVLRDIFTACGFDQVQTYIQSGNVIFAAADTPLAQLEAQAQAQLQATLGYTVEMFVRPLADLPPLLDAQPFPDRRADDGSMLYITFLHQEPSIDQQNALLALANDNEQFHFAGRELYYWRRQQLGKDVFSNNLVEKLLGSPATTRNVTTLNKIVRKYL